MLENVTIDGLFTKHLPKEIRGGLNGVYAFFGYFGLLIYSQVGKSLFTHHGSAAPFVFVAVCDLVVCFILIVLKLLKIFNH